MLLVNFSKVCKEYGGNSVFHDVDFEVLEHERIGLVGENGSGKSTLFKLIVGSEDPSKGTIARKRNLTIGYLQQEIDVTQLEQSVFDFVASSSPELQALSERIKRLEAQMAEADPEQLERVMTAYSAAQERYEALDGYTIEYRVEGVLCGLGFALHEHRLLLKSFSGGEKKLINLARILLQRPDLLLLDEPDNHLDLALKHG